MSQSADLMTALAWSLLHFFWQGAAIAALAAVAMALFRESTTRYVIGVSALALMLMSFVVTFAYLRDAPAGSTELAAAASVVRAGDVPPSPAFAVPAFERPASALLDLAWIARGWLGIVCLLALRVACGLLLLEHLRRRSLLALPVELVERCQALQRRLGISRVVRYCECRLVTVPSVIGFVRPIVLLPMRALTGLSAEQLEAVIAHELGHIKRFDVAVNLFQVVVETLFFFHPAVWWLNKRIRADREECCDDIAIAACGRSVPYARALAVMEGWRGTPELSIAATGGDVASRVARLLGMSRRPSRVRSAGVLTAALVLAAALTAGAASIGIAQPDLTITQPAVPIVGSAPHSQTVAQPEGLLAQVRAANPSRRNATPAPAGAAGGPSFIDEMKSVGLDTTDVDSLIALKIHGVTAEYVREIRDAGLTPDAEDVIAMKIHGVSPEYIAQFRAAGLDPNLDEVVAMKIHGVAPGDITQFRAAGLDPNLDDVLAMKIHGVKPEDVTQFRALGFELDTDDVVALKIHGVTPEFINEARSHGFKDLSIDQIIQLKNAGVL
jgi:beta-lactamase regulating signal transducer with metallopeptidase domain